MRLQGKRATENHVEFRVESANAQIFKNQSRQKDGIGAAFSATHNVFTVKTMAVPSARPT
jgi:hypothetical protein